MIGGGAAGFFAAIAAARAGASVTLLERSRHPLAKVRISGGGRCNVTHACFDPRELARHYPRGGKALIGPFTRFGPAETVAWFGAEGVRLKTEPDGRMFPVTDSSETVIGALAGGAARAGVEVRTSLGIADFGCDGGGFAVRTDGGETLRTDRVLVATGGWKPGVIADALRRLGHGLVEPVPSLFTFHLDAPWLQTLAGVSVARCIVRVPACELRAEGPVVVTHWGLSGPAILRCSAWGARALYACGYRFDLETDWLPGVPEEGVAARFQRCRETVPGRDVCNVPFPEVPARLWEALCARAGIGRGVRWAILRKEQTAALASMLKRCVFRADGKSANKDEFVTAGGIPLREVDFRTMESRIVPGLHFAGEILDVDGITGGFNFQAAWTTGIIAGGAMARGPGPG